MGQLQLNKVQKFYGDYEVLKGVELDVRDGEFVVFVGPSGCGKSTLLRMIAGLDATTKGDIIINGVRVSSHRLGEMHEALPKSCRRSCRHLRRRLPSLDRPG